MSVGHFDHVLIVYSLMEHVTWKSQADPILGHSPSPTGRWVSETYGL